MINLQKSGRILYVTSADISIGNGPGVNEREFVLGLFSLLGDRAHVMIPEPEESLPDGLPEGCVTLVKPHKRHHPLYFFSHVISQKFQADKLFAQKQFDLLAFRLDVLPFGPYYITRKFKTSYALKTLDQGMVNVLKERGGILGRSLVGINHKLVKTIVDNAIQADTVSVMQQKYLVELLSIEDGKLVWIDNAVNTKRFFPMPVESIRAELGLSQFDMVIGYVGTRPWERGGMQLVESLPHLTLKYPNIGVVILGGGDGLNLLYEKAQQLGVTDRCVFTGYVPFKCVPKYVNALDIGVSLSYRVDRMAASELKVRQYLACGKPVILSPGSNDFVEVNRFGSIVDPHDSDAVFMALDHWLSLSLQEKEDFSSYVVSYMQEKMSIEAAISKRLELWSEKLNGLSDNG